MFKFSTIFAVGVAGMFVYIFYPLFVAIHNSITYFPH